MTPTASANCSLPMLMQFLENGLCSENILSLNFIRVVKKKYCSSVGFPTAPNKIELSALYYVSIFLNL